MTRSRAVLVAALATALVASTGVVWVSLEPRSPSSVVDASGPDTPDPVASSDPSTSEPEAAASEDPPVEHTVVEPELARELAASPTQPIESVFLADPPALADPAFQAFAARLTSLGPGLFSGELQASDVPVLSLVEGLRVSKVEPLILEPDLELDPAWDEFFFDVATKVGEVEPLLAATRAAQNIQGAGSVIAIIDSGIDTNAFGLTGKVVHRQDFSSPSGSCSDNGFLDPVGHGTHVASIAAGSVVASDPAASGVAPGATLIDLRVFNCAEQSSTSQLDQALNWVLNNRVAYNISVVNLSLEANGGTQSGTDSSSLLVNKLVASGVFVAVAAGNQGDGPSTIHSPGTARYGTTVGAAGVSDSGAFLAPYSSQGPIAGRHGIDVLAAGSSIVAAKTTRQGYGSTTTKSGTSMAAPYVAGLAALLRQKHPTHVPTGTICGCSDGVSGVTNQLETDISTSDWFTPGEDDLSGRGLVSAVKSLTGAANPAAAGLEVSLRDDSPTVIAIPPHSENVIVNMVTETSIREGAASLDELYYTWFDGSGTSGPMRTPCNLNDVGSSSQCTVTTGWWGQRVWQFMAPASSETSYLSLASTRAVDAVVTVPGVAGVLPSSSGLRAADVALDVAGNGTLTVERTVDAGASTQLQLTTAGGITAPSGALLPAGPAGTTVEIPIAFDPGHVRADGDNGGRVVYSVAGALAGVAGVHYPDAGQVAGRITFAGAQMATRDLLADVHLLTDGTLVGVSHHPTTAMAPATASGYYPGPFIVPAGTNGAVKVPLTQTVPSAIQLYGGSAASGGLLLGEYPGGQGLVPGDSDSRYVTFVHDLESGVNTEIGSASIPPQTYSAVMSEQGESVAFRSDSGGLAKVYWQGGAGFGDLQLVGTFPGSSPPTIAGVTDEFVLIRTFPSALLPHLWLYPVAGGDPLLVSDRAYDAEFSAGGSAVGFSEAFLSDSPSFPYSPACYLIDSDEVVGFPGIDRPLFGALAVADDCGWFTGVVERELGSPRGTLGTQLVRGTPSGDRLVLARNDGGSGDLGWVMDSSATNFWTYTARPIEPGDTNGLTEGYRGLYSSRPFDATPAPTISGTFQSGYLLTATLPVWSPLPTKVTYQWNRAGVPIAGATSPTYLAVDADMGKTLTVAVTGRRYDYLLTTVTSAPTPVITGLALTTKVPTISGIPEVGESLIAKIPVWGPLPLQMSGHWEADGVKIPATPEFISWTIPTTDVGTTIQFTGYQVGPGQAGADVTFVVTGSKPGHLPVTVRSAPLHIKEQFAATPLPQIDGLPRSGSTLAVSFAGWDPVPTSATYAWKRNGVSISGATQSSYKLTSSDAGKSITVSVVASRSGYVSVSKTSAALPIEKLFTASYAPVISGSNSVGSTLIATSGGTWSPSGIAFAYQWKRNGVDIRGATGTSYMVSALDAGRTITVALVGTKSGYTSVTKTSAAVAIPIRLRAGPGL